MPSKKEVSLRFPEILIKWHRRENDRKMPWKGEKDPYKIWLSEVILQQTRVEQGLKYYENFVKAFPDIHALANASEQRIYKLWEGLGYYVRCRNLIETARYVSSDLDGKFPSRYADIKKLEGVGPYIAAAVASFAFSEPYAVVDGNVFRVLSRVFGISKAIDSSEGKKYFSALANELLDKKNPGLFNQAIMDFGAMICRPTPQCELCPFRKYCFAFLRKKTSLLPVKTKKTIVRKRWFNYVVLEYRGKVAIRQRLTQDIWHNLFEFFLIESTQRIGTNKVLTKMTKEGWLRKNSFQITSVSPVFYQRLSHQKIEGNFTRLKLNRKLMLPKDVLWITKGEIKNYAFPQFINQYLQQIADLRHKSAC